MQQNQTAILFFSRTMEEEFKVNNLGLCKAAFSKYFQIQIQRTLAIAQSSGLPIELCFSDQQNGDGFGERLQFALRELRSKGYSSVIVLGNDTPLLNLGHLEMAKSSLLNSNNLIGKDQHGGAWIIALQLYEELLQNISTLKWNSATLYDELKELLNTPQEIETSMDLNSIRDVRILLNSSGVARSLKKLYRDLYKVSHHLQYFILDFPRSILNISALRGPPVMN